MLQDFYRIGDVDTAIVKDENDLVITPNSWSSNNTDILVITNAGLFTCVAPGKAVISAKNLSNTVLAKIAITILDTDLSQNFRIE